VIRSSWNDGGPGCGSFLEDVVADETGDKLFPGAYCVRRSPFAWGRLPKPLLLRARQIKVRDFPSSLGIRRP